jgi:hypothetical protein
MNPDPKFDYEFLPEHAINSLFPWIRIHDPGTRSFATLGKVRYQETNITVLGKGDNPGGRGVPEWYVKTVSLHC